jgi:hypothetical protein
VGTDGELQAGAHGLALSLSTRAEPTPRGVEASVGVVSLEPLDVAAVGPRLERAARALRGVLR